MTWILLPQVLRQFEEPWHFLPALIALWTGSVWYHGGGGWEDTANPSSWSLVPLFCQNYSRSWMLRITKWMQESISSPVGCWQSHPPMLAWLFIANSKRCYLCPKCNHFVVHDGDGEMQGAHFAGGFIALVRVLAKPLATPLVFRCWADLVAYSQCSHALETNTVYWAVRWHY